MLITICSVLAFPCFLAVFFRKRPGETIACSFGCMIMFLYCFYSIDRLQLGVSLLTVLIAACYICAIPKLIQLIKKDGIQASYVFFSPGLCAFLLASILVRLITKGTVSVLWDELRLWSAVPKALFLTHSLQLGESALIFSTMQNYFPGIGLLEYFSQYMVGHYADDLTFFVYGILGIACLMPVAERIEWKRWWMVIGYAVITVLFPLMLYGNPNGNTDFAAYYQTLFIDGLLGLAFSYSLYCGWKCNPISWFSLLRYTVSIATLMLLKESGLLLSILSILFMFGVCIKREKAAWLGCMWTVLLCTVTIVAIKVTWSNLLVVHNISATGSWVSLPAILSAIWKPNEAQLSIWQTFAQMLYSTDLTGKSTFTFLPPSWCTLMFFYTLFSTIIVLITRKTQVMSALLLGGIAELLYTGSMIFLFLTWNAFHSYQRYMNTGMLAIYALLLVIIMELWLSEAKNRKQLSALFIAFVLFFFGYFQPKPVRMPEFLLSEYYSQQHVVSRIESIIRSDYESQEVVSLFLINEGDTNHVLAHHQVYNQLLNYGIAVGNWCYDTSLNSDDPDLEHVLYQKLKSDKSRPYDYLYITNREVEDGYLYRQYEHQFVGGKDNILSGGVYRIEYDDLNETVHFVFCGNAHA